MTKYTTKSKKIKLKWTRPENFDLHCQKLTFGGATQGFSQIIRESTKRTQKLNLELSFETESSEKKKISWLSKNLSFLLVFSHKKEIRFNLHWVWSLSLVRQFLPLFFYSHYIHQRGRQLTEVGFQNMFNMGILTLFSMGTFAVWVWETPYHLLFPQQNIFRDSKYWNIYKKTACMIQVFINFLQKK